MAKVKGHHNRDFENIRQRPSRQLSKIIEGYPSTNAAARALGLSYATLDGWLKDKLALGGRNIAQIISRTGMSYEQLFQHEKE